MESQVHSHSAGIQARFRELRRAALEGSSFPVPVPLRFLLSNFHFLLHVFLEVPLLVGMIGADIWINQAWRSPSKCPESQHPQSTSTEGLQHWGARKSCSPHAAELSFQLPSNIVSPGEGFLAPGDWEIVPMDAADTDDTTTLRPQTQDTELI